MEFIARVCFPENNPPARGYIHNTGINVFESPNKVISAASYLKDMLKKYEEELSYFSYMLAFVWGDEERNSKIIDLIGVVLSEGWGKNEQVHAGLIWNGDLTDCVDEVNEITCGDSAMVLGDEIKHRRNMLNLDEYMKTPPVIKDKDDKEVKLVDIALLTSND